jgi:hypothetical integral membrane protein (TIGR02206 family)
VQISGDLRLAHRTEVQMDYAIVTPTAYLAGVGLCGLGGGALCRIARRARPRAVAACSVLLGALLVADALSWVIGQIVAGTYSASTSLPLALCNAMLVVAALACLWPAQVLVDLTYFIGLAGTAQAVATPDLSVGFPHLQFFQYLVGHCGIVVAALFLVVGERRHPRAGAVRRTWLLAAAYTAVVGLVDGLTGADYMFLRRPPANWTLLRLLGPWPWYVVSAAGLAVVLFVLLDLPFHGERREMVAGGTPGPGREKSSVLHRLAP